MNNQVIDIGSVKPLNSLILHFFNFFQVSLQVILKELEHYFKEWLKLSSHFLDQELTSLGEERSCYTIIYKKNHAHLPNSDSLKDICIIVLPVAHVWQYLYVAILYDHLSTTVFTPYSLVEATDMETTMLCTSLKLLLWYSGTFNGNEYFSFGFFFMLNRKRNITYR